ncbi:hypothetical protein [Micromonospora sp. NPDC049662]|uniref:hypothetical protein n=1 Tax=Micromonospora sp. NPDC049662 TaxID=3155397 RepID=UPI00343CCD47
MTSDSVARSPWIAGYDEPPEDARVRNLIALSLLTPQPHLGTERRLVEFDFNPASHDPIASWEAVLTVEVCPDCRRRVEAGEHVAVTARGRRLCVDCGCPE